MCPKSLKYAVGKLGARRVITFRGHHRSGAAGVFKAESEPTVPRFLYRYRALRDPFDSLQKILCNNLWYCGSRKDFDDQEDMVLPGVVLCRDHIRGLAVERNGNLTPDVESQIEQYLRDPLSERRTTEAIQKDLDEVGILCFSEEPNNRELWKIYASDGKGVCLMLESLEIFPATPVGPIYGPFEVRYSDEDKKPYDPQIEGVTQADDHLLRKRRQWAYQKEWRFIRHRHGHHSTVGYCFLPPGALVGLIFGWKLSSDERAMICEWINAGPFHPQLFDANPNGEEVRITGSVC
jgi:hypothetical protein